MLYTVLPNMSPRLRKLEVVKYILNLLTLSTDVHTIDMRHLYQFLDRLPPEYCIMAMTYALENKKRGPELYETDAYLRYCKKYQQAFMG